MPHKVLECHVSNMVNSDTRPRPTTKDLGCAVVVPWVITPCADRGASAAACIDANAPAVGNNCTCEAPGAEANEGEGWFVVWDSGAGNSPGVCYSELHVAREQQIGGSGGSLEPPGPLLESPGPLLTHLHTVYMAYSECLPTRLNPLAERTCFSQAWSPRRSCAPRCSRSSTDSSSSPGRSRSSQPGASSG